MRVHVCESKLLDQPHRHGGGHGLPTVEQRADTTMLQLQLMQSRVTGESEEGMENSRHCSSLHSDCFDSGLSDRVLCF